MHSPLAFILHFPFGLASQDMTLVVIFGFVLCLIVIKQLSRYQRARLWHDTARLALEKGQPLPSADSDRSPRDEFRRRRFDRHCGRQNPWRYLRRGLIYLAVGIALYYALPPNGQAWALLPGLIGVANVVTWVIYLLRSDKPDDRDDAPPLA